MRVEMIKYHGGKFQDRYLKKDLLNEYAEILTSGSHLQSKWVEDFELTLASRFNIQKAVAVGSCTDALLFSLIAAGVGSNDVILAPAFSFIASVSSAKKLGASVRYIDIASDGALDLDKLKNTDLRKVKALIYVHMYGYISPKVIEVRNFCATHEIFMVEDAAQAFDSKIDGFYAGTIGNVGVLSFDPTKVIAAPGSGGVLLTQDAELASRITRLRYHGKSPNGKFIDSGYNSQMSSIVAATLIQKINNNIKAKERRTQIINLYIKNLPDSMVLNIYKDVASRHSYHKFVIRAERRDELKKYLYSYGVETAIHYDPILPHHESLYDQIEVNKNFETSEFLAKSVLSLPIYDALTDENVEYICKGVLNFYDN